MTFSIHTLLFGYVLLALGALGTVVFLDWRRRKRFEPEPTEDHIFRCTRCGSVYTDDRDVDVSRCAQCGTANEPVEF
jgi:hypothetical protein